MTMYTALIHDALAVTAGLTLIPLGAAAAVSLVVAVLQAATQIQEQSIAFILKILVLCGCIVWLGNAGTRYTVRYTQRVLSALDTVCDD